jgi:predicted transcriptional regulator
MLLSLYMKINYNKIINQIQKVRTKNNVNWMNILRVAIKFAPIEAKKIIKQINLNDKEISKLISKLSK